MTKELPHITLDPELVNEIKTIIRQGRQQVAHAINAGHTATYWQIGKRINKDILQNKRVGYGEQIVKNLSVRLVAYFGNGFSIKNLRRMMQFYEVFSDFQIVATLWRQLSWSHFKILIPLKSELERDFYAQICRLEKWSVQTLQAKVDSMLFERTAISRKPEKLAQQEMKQLKVVEYITTYLPKKLLEEKSNDFTLTAKRQLENRERNHKTNFRK